MLPEPPGGGAWNVEGGFRVSHVASGCLYLRERTTVPRAPRRHHLNGRTRHAQTQTRRKLVLVIEDHASIGGLIAGLIRQEGYRALRSWDAQDVARILRDRRPDLVLLDLSMPAPGGATSALEVVRTSDKARGTPVLAVSGPNALAADERQEITEVVEKPFDIDVMLNAVRRALGDAEVEIEPRQYDAQDYFLNGY